MVQVRSDSSVEQLLQFLSSENSGAASRAAQAELEAKQAEALLLEQVKPPPPPPPQTHSPLRFPVIQQVLQHMLQLGVQSVHC